MIDIQNVFTPKKADGNDMKIISKEMIRKDLGITGLSGTPNQEEYISELFLVFNQVNVSHFWNDKGEYAGAEIPTNYWHVLRSYCRGHKEGESSALH